MLTVQRYTQFVYLTQLCRLTAEVPLLLFRQKSCEVKKEATITGRFLNLDQEIKNYITKEMHDPWI